MTSKILPAKHVYLIASGDLRLSANQNCWPVQTDAEARLGKTLKALGWTVVRAHPFDRAAKNTASLIRRKWAWRSSAISIRTRR